MRKLNFLLVMLLILPACSKDEKKISLIEEKSQNLQMIEIYNEGIKE